MAFCKSCGTSLPDEAKFCPACGSVVSPEEPADDQLGKTSFLGDPQAMPSAQSEQPVQPEQPEAPAQSAPGGGWYQSAPNDYAAYQAQPQPQPAPVYKPAKPPIGKIFDFYRRAFDVLKKKPVRLWGISLLYLLIASLIASLGAMLPLVTVPIVLLLELGFTGILLDGYHGKEVRSEQLFTPFRKEEIARNAGGLCWQALWLLIWGLVPVMNIIKSYSYSLVPYILLTDKEISATEALRKSMRMTDGYKGKMFGADVLLIIGIWLVMLVLVLLSQIPYIGFLFGILLVLAYIAMILFLPIFIGLVHTAIFEDINAVHEE